MGVRYIPTSLQRAGLNPFKDFIFRLNKIKKAENPDIVFSYTVSLWYGSSSAMNVDRIFALITGLYFAFIEKNQLNLNSQQNNHYQSY